MRNITHQNRHAFTLVEIMVAVVIIGLLAALSMPAFKRVTEKTEHTTIGNDLRIFASAFEQYSLENGAWPADGTPGVIPVEMTKYISSAQWTRITSGAGSWKWNLGSGGVQAAIEINNCTFTEERLARLDALLDDGNTSTGVFRKSGTGDPIWVLAE